MENNISAGKRRNFVSKGLLVPFILVTSLFFLWGFAHSLLDVLNKHFQEILGITKAKSGWVQAALYGGYAIMAIPAGLIMSRIGYKKGIIFGLLLYAAGAFLFFPAAEIQTFEFTLFCLFVIACGLTCLETAANPYATVLGPKETSEQRLNFSQAFNGLGWIIGPAVGGWFIFSGGEVAETNKFESMIMPYVIIGAIVLLVAVLFIFTRLPDVQEEGNSQNGSTGKYSHLFRFTHFRFAVVTLFLYVAAQTGINSFFINYVTETMPQFSNEKAAYLLSLGFVFFMAGRFSGSIMMTWFRPNQMLALYAIVNIVAMALVILGLGWVSLISIYVTYFCMSIMFPTIFALGVKDLGGLTKKGSSILIMTVAGGAVCPMLMGWIADISNMAAGFTIPLACFAAVLMFALKGYKVKPVNAQQ